jgi:copper(I)-binding protein
MPRLTRLRMIEIGVALLLTLAALVFVGLTVWAAEPLSIRVADAWARPSIGQSKSTAAYLNIFNEGSVEDVLERARSPKVETVEMHQTTTTPEGVMQMRKVEGGLPVPAGGSLVFSPGGTHLMLVGLKEALNAGDELILTLEFTHAGAIELRVPVSASAPPASP